MFVPHLFDLLLVRFGQFFEFLSMVGLNFFDFLSMVGLNFFDFTPVFMLYMLFVALPGNLSLIFVAS